MALSPASQAAAFPDDAPQPTVSRGPAPPAAAARHCVLVHSDLDVVAKALRHAGYSWDAATHVWWRAEEGRETLDELKALAERHAFPLSGIVHTAPPSRGGAFQAPAQTPEAALASEAAHRHFKDHVDVFLVAQEDGTLHLEVHNSFHVVDLLKKNGFTYHPQVRKHWWRHVTTDSALDELNELKESLAEENWGIHLFDALKKEALELRRSAAQRSASPSDDAPPPRRSARTAGTAQ